MIKSHRIESIDLLRGVVIILMALDHVRDYFHADAFLFDPTDLGRTNISIFLTRWITHYCAPVFVFLSGTSAFLVGVRKGKRALSMFLLKRGLWLVFLELTVVNLAWFFNMEFPLFVLVVIWALGISMIVLAAFVHLPHAAILFSGIVLVAGHNLLDGIHVEGEGVRAIAWAMLHEFKFFPLGESRTLLVGYPLLPWIGVMLLGYCLGRLYQPSFVAHIRRKILTYIGITTTALFLLLRLINDYGDPRPWTVQKDVTFTVLSFLNVSKYPPSLLYVLMTLGPALLFLAFAERNSSRLAKSIIVIGRVPLFYYLLHIYLIHGLAILAAIFTGKTACDMILNTWVTNSPSLKGYGFNLGVVYIVWIGVVLVLYPLCKWYDRYKLSHRNAGWLSYL